ncbi:energy transducer TonB [Hymenobacter cavernae]|uniref:TonB C-terminal domain-containing protein n=1 Tax=Hymenobacter cavernae TaxID=2044852 RepID=A0ABQ1TXA1_9BACT|nr:hypothetical protein GCM10011383_15580 [Hymenobacter cavernae]
MKYAVALCLTLITRAVWAQSAQPDLGSAASTKAPSSRSSVYFCVEHMPEYPNGGFSGVLRYFAQNVRLPEEVKSGRVQGRVFVSFVIDAQGRVQDATIMRGLLPAADLEALRVVRSMSQWLPGSQNGVNVAVSLTLPIMFSLKPAPIPYKIGGISCDGDE